MGYVIDRFFIVHTWEEAVAEEAHKIALTIFEPRLVGSLMEGIVNDAHGFIIWTSGSKIGWSDYEEHTAKTEEFIERLSQLERPPSWTWVSGGEELGHLHVEHGYDGNYDHKYSRASIPKGNTIVCRR